MEATESSSAAPSGATTSLGPVALPIVYTDGASLLAFFGVDPAAAARALAGTGLLPARVAGRAVLGLAFYDYRTTAIGPYHEVGSALVVVPEGAPAGVLDLGRSAATRRVGYRILDLPVSTTIADVAGREIWGYPKFVTDLPMRFDRGSFSAAVADPAGGEILRLEGRASGLVPVPALDLVLYSHLGGRMLRTLVEVKAPTRLGAGRGLRLTLGKGHRMAETLRALGLDGASPFAFARCDGGFTCRLHGGVPVAERSRRPGGRDRVATHTSGADGVR